MAADDLSTSRRNLAHFAVAGLVTVAAAPAFAQASVKVQALKTPAGRVVEYVLDWPGAPATPMPAGNVPSMPADPYACCPPGGGSTHELAFDRNGGSVFWVSGQLYDHIARVRLDGTATFFPMPPGSAPHGMSFDLQGRLWVTFEGLGQLVRIDSNGSIAETIDVSIHAKDVAGAFNPRPHGLGIGTDGALCFTGKLSNTIGRVDAARNVQHFVLPTIGAVPIYISAGPDGSMWFTELGLNRLGKVMV